MGIIIKKTNVLAVVLAAFHKLFTETLREG
jgi:hypothetical protein